MITKLQNEQIEKKLLIFFHEDGLLRKEIAILRRDEIGFHLFSYPYELMYDNKEDIFWFKHNV